MYENKRGLNAPTSKMLTFDQNVKKYNKGITLDKEIIQAKLNRFRSETYDSNFNAFKDVVVKYKRR